ncbi:MAG: hypothetical protein K8T91_06470 [Planctomycetes bacterium]|nr:hypothetical protein [Planctomycetota bacterium]
MLPLAQKPQTRRSFQVHSVLLAVTCCALTAAIAGAAAATGAAVPGEPIATRQNVFAIPFQVSPARTPAESPKAVQLYVSDDRGANWRLEKQLEPGVGRFPFRAAHDGEFWFQVRTIDANNRVLPDGPQQPGLKVLVDTVSPSIELSAVEDQAGEVVLQWRCTDPSLDTGTLKIESQAAAAGQWFAVPTNEADIQRAPQNNSGRARFRVAEGANEVAVRLEIGDRAGNRATSQATVKLNSRIGGAATGAAGAGTAAAGMGGTNGAGGTPAQTASLPNNGATATGNPPAFNSTSNEPGVKPWPADQVANRPPTSNPSGSQTPLVPLVPAPNPPVQPPAMANTPARSASEGFPPSRSASEGFPPATNVSAGNLAPPPLTPISGSGGMGASPITPLPSAQLPANWTGADKAAPPLASAAPAAQPPNNIIPRSLFDPSILPAGVTPQQVNVLKFQVDYGVEAVGPAGVGRVELWGTRDGGRTWQSFGLDSDNKSPLVVTVPGNGLYGFRIIVSDTNGRGEPAPRNGDTPQVWIAVDASPPEVHISPPIVRGETVPIIFTVADEQLDPQSVSLFYSHRADGAWIPITQGLGNVARYDWAPQPGISGPVFLRIEARDRGGNIGSATTREPLLLDRPVPKSTISGIRPS